MRRSVWKAVVKNAPNMLRGAEKSVRDGVMEILRGSTSPKWTGVQALEAGAYAAFHEYLQRNLDHPRNTRSIIPNFFRITKQLQILGKTFGSLSTQSAQTHGEVRNSLIEYKDQNEKQIGRIKYFFCTSELTSVFVFIEPFVALNPEDDAKNIYRDHPGLHATLAYDRLGPPVVVDTLDLCGHIALVKTKPNAFQIRDQTVAAVSLRNLVRH